ncbi:MAG: hypothetical protein QXT62_02750, partial [Thermoplasmata archaeon]
MTNEKEHRSKKAFDKGLELFNKENYEKAIEKFDEVISLDYMDVTSHIFRARTLLILEEYEKLEKELKEIESISPNDLDLLILKSRYY